MPNEKVHCIITDYNDAEAAEVVRNRNVPGHLATTLDIKLLAAMKSVSGQVPDPESLLRKAPQIEGQSTPDAAPPAGDTPKTTLPKEIREKKIEPSGSHIYILTVLPVAKYGDASESLAKLESLASVTVQRTGEEPTPS